MAAFLGLLVFAAGFLRHGLDASRSHARILGIEQALAGMERLISRPDLARVETRALILPPDLDTLPKRGRVVTGLLACAGGGIALWAACVGLDSISHRETGWMTACLVVVSALAVGIWTGLVELRNNLGGSGSNMHDGPRPRGASGWLMRIGTLCSAGPVFAVLFLFLSDSLNDVGTMGGVVLYVLVLLIAPLGIVFFTTGFALHGLRIVRHRERIRELEQVKAAMEEEVSRLGAGA